MESSSDKPQVAAKETPKPQGKQKKQTRRETPDECDKRPSSPKRSSPWNTKFDSESEFTPPGSASKFFKTEPELRKADSGACNKTKAQKQKEKFARHDQRRAQKEARAELDRERQQEEAAQARRKQRKSTHPSFVQSSTDKSEYDALHRARHFRNAFPTPESSGFCPRTQCIRADSFVCCHHDLERFLRSGGEFSEAWLKKERLLWHPDKFVGKGNGVTFAADMFKMIQRIIEGFS
ncbi:hypothetical protein VTL71DRAFT_5736 [Oculimacula yallundae]|uniref:Uncharacterized protein n=1 Tax=Oculimacula yallundae TaxID=86028 RepID=A0ABR4BYB7_9HELO